MNQSLPSNPKPILEATAIRFLSYRPRFKIEVVNCLVEKAKEINLADFHTLINQIIASLEKSGFINDSQNLESFIHHRLEVKLKGPFYIKSQLLRLGLTSAEIESGLHQNTSLFKQNIAINCFINKKLLGKKPNHQIKAKLIRALLSRGFSIQTILAAFARRFGRFDSDLNSEV